jgi:serine/threonine protein kinase
MMAAQGPKFGGAGEELTPGHLLAGKYLIDRVLGRGGVGIVVAATHLALEQKVAIKFLRSDTTLTAETIERFLREARAAAMIRSEHVCRVHDFGTSDEGLPYIVMEHLEGTDLGDLLEKGPLPVEAVVEYVLQACLALAEAHRAGIVHRDLKPANLFLTHRADGLPIIKVLDFGISKVIPKTPRGSNAAFVTTSTIMGSPEYMSPEQMRSTKDVDQRADIWALGVVMYELLTARAAFTADTIQQLFYAIEKADPAPIESFRDDVPDILKDVIARCLKKDREARFFDIGELALAMRYVASPRAEPLVDAIVGTLRGAASTAKPTSPPLTDPPLPGERTILLARARRASAPTIASAPELDDVVSGLRTKAPLVTPRIAFLALLFVAVAGGLAFVALGVGATHAAPAVAEPPSTASPEARVVPQPTPQASAQPASPTATVDSHPSTSPPAVVAAPKPSPATVNARPNPVSRTPSPPSPVVPVTPAPVTPPPPVSQPASGTAGYGDRK